MNVMIVGNSGMIRQGVGRACLKHRIVLPVCKAPAYEAIYTVMRPRMRVLPMRTLTAATSATSSSTLRAMETALRRWMARH